MRFSFTVFTFSILLVLLSFQVLKAQDRQAPKIGIASYYHGWLDGKKTANGEKYDETKMTAAHLSLPFNSKVKVTNLNNHKSIIVRINDRGPFINRRIIDLSRAAADSLDFVYNGLAKVQLTILSYGKPNDATHQQLMASIKTAKPSHSEAVKEPLLPKDTALLAISMVKPVLFAFEEPKIQVTAVTEIKIKETQVAETNIVETKPLSDNNLYGLQIGSFKVKNNADKLLTKIKSNFKEETSIQEIKKGNSSFFRLIIGKFADKNKVAQLKEKMNKDYPESFMIRY